MPETLARSIRRTVRSLDFDVLPILLFIVPVVAPVLFLLLQRSLLAFVTF